MKPISPKEAEKRMLEIFSPAGYDNEGAHSKADDLLCEILISWGYKDAVGIFLAAEKWYA